MRESSSSGRDPRGIRTTAATGAIGRRTVLRGAGVALTLPWLEAMGPVQGVARAAGSMLGAGPAAGAPLRMAFVFSPNGVNYPHWKPRGGEDSFTLSPTLEPLGAVREHVNIITGLTLDKARANGDGPGDHARSSATFLTGRQARKTAGNDIRLGISVDQFAAQQIGDQTRLPSLELCCENGRAAGNCDSGYSCAYSANISWRDEDTPVPKLINPAAVFDRMFGDVEQSVRQREILRRRGSVLDYVRNDSKRMERRLGRADRRKLDEFQTSVREIEQRIERSADDSGDIEIPEMQVPAGVPRKLSEHLDLMYDMMLLAFQTDTTRISTFMTGTGGSNRSFPEIGVTEGHHHLSHHKNNQAMVEKIRRIDRFYVDRFAKFVERMASTREGEGSLLDNCMIVYGSGICDGNRHNHENLPILMAGRGGGAFETGRLVEFPRETPLCDLYVALLEQMGCEIESFGDSRGALKV